MPRMPEHIMSDEPYILTEAQIDALNAMPPGVYFVCVDCRRFCPAPVTIVFKGLGGLPSCEECS